MEFLSEYGIFLAKAITVLVVLLVVIIAVAAASSKGKRDKKAELRVTKLNDELAENKALLEEELLSKEVLKQREKDEKKLVKEEKKSRNKSPEKPKPRVFVLDFDGDIKASDVTTLRESITTLLQVADPQLDEVVIKLESGGGMVHSYGLAAAQLDRVKKAGLRLTVAVDKVAASGGYMMACVADKIIASPFAIVGSIGVVAQLPNFHKLLKKNDIDYEILTAGEYKRTLTMFGENTDKGRAKFQDDLEDTHGLFKSYVNDRRPQVDIDVVANGDIWFGSQALENKLIDEVMTSDEYVVQCCQNADVYSIAFKEKKTLADKLGFAVASGVERAFLKFVSEQESTKGMRA
ncbi:protease SohB [Oleiphilus sp. HI0009]|uniref:protease SohB n=1 Tax=unclassified Oleiphilus TaxID=2631174 RepID=UPI0007C39123|nr:MULTISPECIES: protease SohB [unclassified Oleiphilus]KZX77548.1 protease SohB [Oleiphilus sp. HI0009]KZY69082.1 protease SohB [Oleiphilus sp. HI0067]KZY69388.1 protease SohB [Oleiphilus sp. HI0066]